MALQWQSLCLLARSYPLHAPVQAAQAPVTQHQHWTVLPTTANITLPCCSNCSFAGNNASYAAAFAAYGSAAVELRFNTFYNNTASTNGAVAIVADTAQVRKLFLVAALAGLTGLAVVVCFFPRHLLTRQCTA